MKKVLILLVAMSISLFSMKVQADELITHEDLPQETKIEFGKTITVERGKDFRILIPGRDYLPNNSKAKNANVTVENFITSDGYIYLKGKFDNIGQYLIEIDGSYFLFNVVEVDNAIIENVRL